MTPAIGISTDHSDDFFFDFFWWLLAVNSPDSDLLDVRNVSADLRLAFSDCAVGFFAVCVLRCVGTGADGPRARRRRSTVQKAE